MKHIRLLDSHVVEIIPDIEGFSIFDRFSKDFTDQLISIDDEVEVEVGMFYSSLKNAFFKPTQILKKPLSVQVQELAKSNKNLQGQNEELKSQNKMLTEQVEALSGQLDFQEECLVEMAGVVYA